MKNECSKEQINEKWPNQFHKNKYSKFVPKALIDFTELQFSETDFWSKLNFKMMWLYIEFPLKSK